jgi:hypothetical protein
MVLRGEQRSCCIPPVLPALQERISPPIISNKQKSRQKRAAFPVYAKNLSLGKLFAPTRLAQADFFPLHLTRIARDQSSLAQ